MNLVFYYFILIFLFFLFLPFFLFFFWWSVVEQGSSSLTFGERICAACIPLIAIIEAVVITVASCFRYRPPVQKCRFDVGDLARLAAESRCNFFFSWTVVSDCRSWFLICLRSWEISNSLFCCKLLSQKALHKLLLRFCYCEKQIKRFLLVDLYFW